MQVMNMSRAAAAAIAMIVIATCLRVAATHDEFSLTIDEPLHIAAGYDYLTDALYTWDIEHPPLTRAAAAAAIVLDGVPKPPIGWWNRGIFLLEHGDQYRHRLSMARAGNLFFLALGITGVAAWGWRRIGPLGAVIAALLFAMIPSILAHAGLATTDMGGAAVLPWALLTLERWMDRPTVARALLLGAAVGFGSACKFSFLAFFTWSAIMLMAVRRFRPHKTAVAIALAALFVVFAAYRFEGGTLAGSYKRSLELVDALTPWHARPIAYAVAEQVKMPAPLFVNGLMDVAVHNRRGQRNNYLFGESETMGWWYYFIVVLLLKTPMALLLLFAAGVFLAIRRRDLALPALFAAMLLMTFRVNINIGVRHVLPLYVPMALLAADAVVRSRGRWRFGAAALVAAVVGVSASAHPDYLPWFNLLAGRHPERIVGESNVDWSQDGLRLARLCKELGIDHVLLTTHIVEPTLPDNRRLRPEERLQDQWVAVGDWAGLQLRQEKWAAVPDIDRATRRYRVGKTITLYYIPQ